MHELTLQAGIAFRLSRALRTRSDPAGERGQVLVLFALFLVVFLGAAALTIDYGSWLSARRNYQASTDSATLAGVRFLSDPGAKACATAGIAKEICARRAAWANLNTKLGLGLTPAEINTKGTTNVGAAGVLVGEYKVWVDTPPSAAGTAYPGTIGGLSSALFARVERQQATFFGRVFGYASFNVGAWSTADSYPNRFAVITLRRGSGTTAIDAGPSNAEDIKLAGSGSTLTIIGGDVGGNWGMKLTSGTLKVYRPSAIYLRDYISCGSACWNDSDVVDDTNTTLASTYPPDGVKKLPRFVPDPNYLPPSSLNSNASNGPTTDIPIGDFAGNVTINSGSVSGATCAAGSPRIGPGTYSYLRVRTGKCLILDPVNRYLGSDPDTPTGTSPVAQTQLPGVFYFTGQIRVDNNALIVGDGVTMVVRPDGSSNQFTPNGIVDVNTGKVSGGSGQILGGWTTKNASPYAWNSATNRWIYQSSQETDVSQFGRGLALYVLKPSQYQVNPPPDENTTVIQVTSVGAGLAWNGVTYAPHDNVAISGQPNHDGIGQLVSWTFTFNGGTNVTQTYDGPDEGIPYLVEPCTSATGGSC